MSRPRKMTSEQMISVIDSYFALHAEENPKLIKCSLIANYANEIGYSAKGYDFARNVEVREYIEELKCCAEAQSQIGKNQGIALAYKTLDIDSFINANRNINKLKNSLAELDEYWKLIYDQASKIFAQNKKLVIRNREYENMLKEHKTHEEELESKIKEMNMLQNRLVFENRYLRKMIKKYLYPSLADDILEKENMLKHKETQVKAEAIKDMTETGIPKSFSESIANDIDEQNEVEKLLEKMWGMCDE